MKAYKGVEVQPHAFVTSALDAYMWSDSPPGHLNPGKCIGPWVCPFVVLDVLGKRKISSHGNIHPTISRSYNQQRSRYVAWTVADYICPDGLRKLNQDGLLPNQDLNPARAEYYPGLLTP